MCTVHYEVQGVALSVEIARAESLGPDELAVLCTATAKVVDEFVLPRVLAGTAAAESLASLQAATRLTARLPRGLCVETLVVLSRRDLFLAETASAAYEWVEGEPREVRVIYPFTRG